MKLHNLVLKLYLPFVPSIRNNSLITVNVFNLRQITKTLIP
ncbi:hypothetical protein CZ765_10300 [Corynebacterium casei]|nr:hypothetical protein CZ765_10300 [Corynebacterium casei]